MCGVWFGRDSRLGVSGRCFNFTPYVCLVSPPLIIRVHLPTTILLFGLCGGVRNDRWDVDGHLQGYGRALGVLFTTVGSFEVSTHSSSSAAVADLVTVEGGDRGDSWHGDRED